MSRSNSDTSLSMKLPSNYFMQWLRENMSDGKINMDFHFDDKKRYLDAFLEDEIDKWSPERPVIISAQTGAGKNHFIQKTLLPKLIDENPTQNNLMLILSNRIALNRQTKHKLAELLVEYKHESKYLEEIREFYTPEGIDKIFINLDVVTVCSYHQLYERCIRPVRRINDPNFVLSIDISKFKYIICDECHFFTSDASFNKDTYRILKEIVSKGQNAIRIYMSATPEVAVEGILREEFAVKEIYVNQQIGNIEEEMNCIKSTLQGYSLLGLKKKNLNKANKRHIKEQCKRFEDLNDSKEVFETHFNLSFDFYYMARHYDYVEPHIYQRNEELIDLVRKSSSKWIIFSDSVGSRIYKMLKDSKERNVESIFLSRKGIENSKDKRSAYNYIINKETIDKKVLVTTSVLDNGINITNSSLTNPSHKVLNIAIDSFDRVQFIQMLGRIREEKDTSIQLYIKEYSLTDLQGILTRDTKYLVQMLYDEIHHRQYYDNDDSPPFFNSFAICQLINRMSNILSIIRNEEPNYCMQLSSPKDEAKKGFVYDFYKNGVGRDESWSRNIVDLLESVTEMNKRKRYIEEDIDNGESDVTRYESKLKDTFIRYIYQTLIPLCYESEVLRKYNRYVSSLSEKEKNRYNYLISTAKGGVEQLSVVDKIEILSKNFDFPSKDVLINMDSIREMNNKSAYYKNLANELCSGDFIDERLRWIEKTIDGLVESVEITPLEQDQESADKPIEHMISSYIVSKEDIKQLKNNQVDKKFLESHLMISKDSDEETKIARQFFQCDSLTNALHKPYTIKGTEYTLESFNDNSNKHHTYYCLVKCNNGE